MEKRKKFLIVLTAILLMVVMASVLFLFVSQLPARADGEETKQTVETETELEEKDNDNETGGYIPDPDSDKKGGTDKEKPEEKDKIIYNLPEISETKDSAPHYHTIGQYDGYVVELKAYEFDPEYSYEYCDVFDHFFDNGTLRWTSGRIPECNGHHLAVFTCSVCNADVTFSLSGEHSFTDSSSEVNGFTVKVCETCGKNVCTDFYIASTPIGNWGDWDTQNDNGNSGQGSGSNSSGTGTGSNSGSSGTGVDSGSVESFLSDLGVTDFFADVAHDDSDVIGKIIAGVMLFVLIGLFFMIPSFGKKKRK